MKKTLQEEKQRILQIMKQLNEQAFNDAGEPLMTHQQYRDYSEPAEPDYESDEYRNAPDRVPTKEDIITQIEKHFDTILYSGGGTEYFFTTNRLYNSPDIKCDLMLWFDEDNTVAGSGPDCQKFEEQNIEDLDINELFDFLESYRKYMLTGKEAEDKINKYYAQQASDSRPEYHTGG